LKEGSELDDPVLFVCNEEDCPEEEKEEDEDGKICGANDG
jgi:hypothetical protein